MDVPDKPAILWQMHDRDYAKVKKCMKPYIFGDKAIIFYQSDEYMSKAIELLFDAVIKAQLIVLGHSALQPPFEAHDPVGMYGLYMLYLESPEKQARTFRDNVLKKWKTQIKRPPFERAYPWLLK